MKKIRKAVFPVAGLGTRFLPATKAQPKEMLPVVDKPLIQYAVEEAVAAGITEMVFIPDVTSVRLKIISMPRMNLNSNLKQAARQACSPLCAALFQRTFTASIFVNRRHWD
jgi:UTP--glucose-1-phosphate uridylyltransferase